MTRATIETTAWIFREEKWKSRIKDAVIEDWKRKFHGANIENIVNEAFSLLEWAADEISTGRVCDIS